jgi:hypothetical protein
MGITEVVCEGMARKALDPCPVAVCVIPRILTTSSSTSSSSSATEAISPTLAMGERPATVDGPATGGGPGILPVNAPRARISCARGRSDLGMEAEEGVEGDTEREVVLVVLDGVYVMYRGVNGLKRERDGKILVFLRMFVCFRRERVDEVEIGLEYLLYACFDDDRGNASADSSFS